MVGIIPSVNSTYEVYGDFNCDNLIEGKLYYDNKDGRVYYYSTIEDRSNPRTGYYPVWDGKNKYITSFSNNKYFDKDVLKMDIITIGKSVSKEIADRVRYEQRKSDDDEILDPQISDEDNMFTQCIKGVIKVKKLTMVDLVDSTKPPLEYKVVENYYIALTKITFMRFDKWNVWINIILHLNYIVEIYKDNKQLLSYNYHKNEFNTGVVRYDDIVNTKEDPFKKIIKIIMIMENITKNTLKSEDVDDYTINNMMTTLSGNKTLSAQLFSRFLRMANLSYSMKMYENDNMIFEFKE